MSDLHYFQRDNEKAIPGMAEEDYLEIIEDIIQKKYLSRLTEMSIAIPGKLLPLEEDMIDNIRMYKITEMVYKGEEAVADKFTRVFSSMSIYKVTTFVVMDLEGGKRDFYIGIRNDERDETLKRSTADLGENLKKVMENHFPGIKLQNEDRGRIAQLSKIISEKQGVAAVSIQEGRKSKEEQSCGPFIRGLKDMTAMIEKEDCIGIFLAKNRMPKEIQLQRRRYRDIYTKLCQLQKIQFLVREADITAEGIQKEEYMEARLDGFIDFLNRKYQNTREKSKEISSAAENKVVTDLLQSIEEALEQMQEYDLWGMWNVAAYFLADNMSQAEITACNYRSFINQYNSGSKVTAINSWTSSNPYLKGSFKDLVTCLSRFIHPGFYYDYDKTCCTATDLSAEISGKELGMYLAVPELLP